VTAFNRLTLASLTAALALAAPVPALAAGNASTPIKVTGEIIDTWCYYSGVMGSQDAVVGTAHHTCALWCAAGGIPVGMRADDGTVYLVLKLEGAAPLANKETLLDLQSDKVTATGLHYVRDGVNYIVVEKVVANEGIVNQTHKDFGPVPPFAIPEPKK
jgi:hypothetical protein